MYCFFVLRRVKIFESENLLGAGSLQLQQNDIILSHKRKSVRLKQKELIQHNLNAQHCIKGGLTRVINFETPGLWMVC